MPPFLFYCTSAERERRGNEIPARNRKRDNAFTARNITLHYTLPISSGALVNSAIPICRAYIFSPFRFLVLIDRAFLAILSIIQSSTIEALEGLEMFLKSTCCHLAM